jgi:hypothetical protein
MPGNRWTSLQIEALIDQIVHQRKPLPEIDVPGKSRAAINNQRKRLQLAGLLNGAFPGREVKPWTFPELKKLTAFTQEYGFSAFFISQMGLLPGRSKDSISKMMGRHGLGNPAVKARARSAQRLDPERRDEFKRFLLDEGRRLPSIEVARRWGIAQKTVTACRRRWGIRLSWREARSSEEFRRQQRRRAKAFVDHTRERWRQWRARRRLAWEKLKQDLAQRRDCPPPRVCQACGEQWYATREFFHVRVRRSGDRVKISYCRVCRLCRAERRRNRGATRASDSHAVNACEVRNGASVCQAVAAP